MPSKDPVKRKANRQAWQEKNHTPEYMKWLYERRMMHRELAEMFERAIREAGGSWHVLDVADQRRREIGNRYDHELNKPYYEEK